jgi:PAS domain-containing protein
MTSAVVLSTAELKAHRAATRIFGNRHAGIAMNASPDFAEPRTVQTAGHPVAPASAEINGNRYDNFVDAKEPSTERRRRPSPSTTDEYLHALPALILLDRLPIPMLATGLDGVVVYTNPAFATMLGHHPDTITLTGQRLSALLAGQSATPPRDCVTALRAADTVIVDWLHAEGFPVRSVISDTLFVRATDQILLIGVTDITELMWTNPPQPR